MPTSSPVQVGATVTPAPPPIFPEWQQRSLTRKAGRTARQDREADEPTPTLSGNPPTPPPPREREGVKQQLPRPVHLFSKHFCGATARGVVFTSAPGPWAAAQVTERECVLPALASERESTHTGK